MRAVRLIAKRCLAAAAASPRHRIPQAVARQDAGGRATLAVLGNAYVADGKPDLALQQFEKPPLSIRMTRRSRQGSAFRRSTPGRVSKVSRHSSKCSLRPGASVAGPTLVVSELRARRFDKAAEVASSLINRDAKNPIYHNVTWLVRAAQRDYPGAESAFRAALAIDRELPAATRDLAQLYAATGRVDEAKKVYGDLLAKRPTILLRSSGSRTFTFPRRDGRKPLM